MMRGESYDLGEPVKFIQTLEAAQDGADKKTTRTIRLRKERNHPKRECWLYNKE